MQAQDTGPYNLAAGQDVVMERHMEASLILTKQALDELVPWLQIQREKLDEDG